jgi:hypothetical protein
MELDIQKLRQEAYCFDFDNYGLDIIPEDDDDLDDPDWPDDFVRQEKITA